jgi:hypothetical protein
MRGTIRWSGVIVTLGLLLGLIGFSGPSVVAQSDGEEQTGTLELIKLACAGQPATEIIVFTPLEVAGGLAEAGHDQCRGATASFQIIPHGDQSLVPIPFDAAVGVNELTLPVGDHTLVELDSGATATFPIEELATSRVFVLNPMLPDDGTTPPTAAPAPPTGVPTSLPDTGVGATHGEGSNIALTLAGVMAVMAAGVAFGMHRRIAR